VDRFSNNKMQPQEKKELSHQRFVLDIAATTNKKEKADAQPNRRLHPHQREKRTCASVKRARINNSGRQPPNQNQRGEVCGSVGATSVRDRAPTDAVAVLAKNAGSCRPTPPLRRPHVSRPDGDGRDRVGGGGGNRTMEPHVGPSEVEARTHTHSSERQWAARCGTYPPCPGLHLLFFLSLPFRCRFNRSAGAFVSFRFTPTDSLRLSLQSHLNDFSVRVYRFRVTNFAAGFHA
jgi:hypothetical protein